MAAPDQVMDSTHLAVVTDDGGLSTLYGVLLAGSDSVILSAEDAVPSVIKLQPRWILVDCTTSPSPSSLRALKGLSNGCRLAVVVEPTGDAEALNGIADFVFNKQEQPDQLLKKLK